MADQGSEGLLSPFLRKKRINAVKPFLRGKVLDYGCGSGHLTAYVAASNYVGVDQDAPSIELAQQQFPEHRFVSQLSQVNGLAGQFDVVASLAVIEHVDDPGAFLGMLANFLKPSPGSSLVITTPHPSTDWVHDAGACIGLFSKHANEEHHELLDRSKLTNLAAAAGLVLVTYKRFLLGANQVVVYRRLAA